MGTQFTQKYAISNGELRPTTAVHLPHSFYRLSAISDYMGFLLAGSIY